MKCRQYRKEGRKVSARAIPTQSNFMRESPQDNSGLQVGGILSPQIPIWIVPEVGLQKQSTCIHLQVRSKVHMVITLLPKCILGVWQPQFHTRRLDSGRWKSCSSLAASYIALFSQITYQQLNHCTLYQHTHNQSTDSTGIQVERESSTGM